MRSLLLKLLVNSMEGIYQQSKIRAKPVFSHILLRKCACIHAGNRVAANFATTLINTAAIFKVRFNKILWIPGSALIVFLAQGCYIFYPPSYNPPPGILYENSAISQQITTPTDLGNKTGSSCIKSYMGLVSFGNASVQAAAASKGIRIIKALDYERYSILAGAYTKLCTIVHGE